MELAKIMIIVFGSLQGRCLTTSPSQFYQWPAIICVHLYGAKQSAGITCKTRFFYDSGVLDV